MVHFYCCSLNTDGKNNEREKYAKHSQKKKVTGSWINVLNKLSPSTHSRNCHNLVYWFITKNTHICRHYGIKYKEIWFRLLHLIFLASFFTKHMYIIFIYQHPWNHPLLQKAFTGESLEVAIHLNEIFLLIKKAMCDWLRPWKTGFLQSTHQ